jgi:autotransporter-associated beta strand protein
MVKVHMSTDPIGRSHVRLLLLVCGCACTLHAPDAHAATWWFNPATLTTTVSGTAYLWSTLSNWNSLAAGSGTAPAAVPGASDDVVFNVTGSNSLSGTYALAAARSVNSLTMNTSGASSITRNSGTAGGTFNLSIGSGGITLGPSAGSLYFSFNTAPLAAQRVAVRASGSSLPVTNNSNSLLSFEQYVDNSLVSGTSTITVATNGAGGVTFLNGINNGATSTTAVVINSAGSGTTTIIGNSASTYTGGTTLTAGILTPLRFALGTGPLVLNGGSYVCDTQQQVSSVTLTSGTLFANGNLVLGAGSVTVSGGQIVSNGNGRILDNAFTLAGDLTLGGTFNLTISNSNQFGLGGATRTISVSDATLAIQGNVINGGIVKTGTGVLSLSGANTYSGTTSVAQGTLFIASTAALPGWDTSGRYTVQSGAALGVGDGVSDAEIGTILGTGNLSAGSTIAITTSTVASTLSAAVNGIGLVKSGSNTLTLTGANTPTATTVSGGVLQVGAGGTVGSLSGDVAVTGSTATLAFNRSDDIVFAGAISGGGNLVKNAANRLTLSANSTYTGATSVLAGTLFVNGDNSAAPGDVNIAGGILGGSGTLGGALMAGAAGTIAPGASIGILTGTQAVSFTDGSILAYELNTASVTADLLRVGGNLSLTGTVAITLTDLSTSTAVTAGTVLSLINYGGSWNSGLFTYNTATLADGDTFTLGANQWRIEYASAVQGSNVTTPIGSNFVNLIVVPEPTVWMSGGLVLLVLAARRRSL